MAPERPAGDGEGVGKMLWRRIPQINSEVECSRLAFAFWKRGEWMQALSGGIRWDLDVGEKNRSLDVVFEILPWATEVPIPILTV